MSAVVRLFHMKSEHHFSERCYDDFIQFLREVLPDDNKMIDNFYRTKKLVQGLGLPVEKIDCCNNNCMIYWGDDSALTSCKFCNHPRFKRKRGSYKHKKKSVIQEDVLLSSKLEVATVVCLRSNGYTYAMA